MGFRVRGRTRVRVKVRATKVLRNVYDMLNSGIEPRGGRLEAWVVDQRLGWLPLHHILIALGLG